MQRAWRQQDVDRRHPKVDIFGAISGYFLSGILCPADENLLKLDE